MKYYRITKGAAIIIPPDSNTVYDKNNHAQRILGSTLHARDFVRQKIESMIGCSVLNKMTRLGMPASYRCA